MRALKTRERILVAALPPLFVAWAYFGWIRPDVTGRIDGARASLAAARASGASGSDPSTSPEEASRLAGEVASLRRGIEQRVAAWSDPGARPAVVRELQAAFVAAGAVLVESEAEAAAKAPSIPLPLRDLATRMAGLGAPAPILWRLRLRGPFSVLCAAIDAASRIDGFALPLTLSMAPPAEGGPLTLTLWLWI